MKWFRSKHIYELESTLNQESIKSFWKNPSNLNSISFSSCTEQRPGNAFNFVCSEMLILHNSSFEPVWLNTLFRCAFKLLHAFFSSTSKWWTTLLLSSFSTPPAWPRLGHESFTTSLRPLRLSLDFLVLQLPQICIFLPSTADRASVWTTTAYYVKRMCLKCSHLPVFLKKQTNNNTWCDVDTCRKHFHPSNCAV